jgi:hypothetical protein
LLASKKKLVPPARKTQRSTSYEFDPLRLRTKAQRSYIAGEGDGDASASELFFLELFVLEDELDEDVVFLVPLL